MATWLGPELPPLERLSAIEWIRALLRGVCIVVVMAVLMICFWIARLLEIAFGTRRMSNFVIWLACRSALWLCGVRIETRGAEMTHGGAWVCNHCSWLDIFALRGAGQMFFVAKSEVRGWPVVGFVADQTGTMFIERKRTEAKRQEAMFAKRLHKNDRLCFFPEGTSNDGLRVLPFKSTLFNVFLTPEMIDETWVQPVTLFYEAPVGQAASFYGWWDTRGLGEHLLQVLGKSRSGVARVFFHEPVRARHFSDRKALSKYCEKEVRRSLDGEIERLRIAVPAPRD